MKEEMSFEVKEGEKGFVVSDPSYKKWIWCQGILDGGVKPGKWFAVARVDPTHKRVSKIYIQSEGFRKSNSYELMHDLGVDSGQLGIFPESTYPEGKNYGPKETPEKKDFYSDVCAITLRKPYFGIPPKGGIVSESGFGDGCYRGTVYRNKDGLIVKV